MLKILKGDLFQSDAECITNTTNSVGVMGKGVALAFKEKYPKECEAYNKFSRKILERHVASLLKPKFITLNTLFNPRYIMFFPTKIHWKNPSKLEYIERNLPLAFQALNRMGVKSVAMPWPGCGNGGLDIKDVRQIIETYIDTYNGQVTIYEKD